MDRATEAAFTAAPKKPSTTPKTEAARFVITPRDVGSEAVRAGHMAEMEEQRRLLLVAAKLALGRAQSGKSTLDSVSEFALESAIKVADSEF